MSKFQGAFDFMRERCKDDYSVFGDMLLVEQIPDEEVKTASGIVIADSLRSARMDGMEVNKPLFCRILEKGEGFIDEKGNEATVAAEVGDIVLIPQLSVLWFSKFGPLISSGSERIGITRESEIKIRFNGQKGYDSVVGALKLGLAESGNR